MNTSILTVVLASALLAGQSGSPTWQNNYSHAQKLGADQKKPLVVAIGSGANGWAKVIQEASPSAEVTQLLARQYVCVYIDTASPAGQQLARSFEIDGTGLVISDKTGAYQAFWHQGSLDNQTLARQLVKFADPVAPQAAAPKAPEIRAAPVTPEVAAGSGTLPSTRTLKWQSNYNQAQQLGSAQKKPLAIMFGSGPSGWKKVSREASLRGDVAKVLSEKYVCVYVDTANSAGAKLAQNFEISGKVGMVLSDRDGASQAFWHQGDLTDDNMVHYLQKYADPTGPVRGTETVNTVRTSYYPAQQPTARPAFSSGSC